MSNRGRGPTRDHPEDGSAGLSRKRMLQVANFGPPKVGTLPVRGNKKHKRGGFRGSRNGAATDVGLPPSVGAVSSDRGGGSSSGSRGHRPPWSGHTFDSNSRRGSSDRQGSLSSSSSRHAHPLPSRPPSAMSSQSQDEPGPSTKRSHVDNADSRQPRNAGRYTPSASAMDWTGYAPHSPPAAGSSTMSGYVPPYPAPKPVPSDPVEAREEANVASTSKSVAAPSMSLAADEAVGHKTTAPKPPNFTPRNHNQRENDSVPSASTIGPPPGPAKEPSPAPPQRLKVVPRNHNVRPNAPAPAPTAPVSPTTLLQPYTDNSYSANRPAPKWNPNIKPRNHNVRPNDPVAPPPPPALPAPQALLPAPKRAPESRQATLSRSVTPTATSSETQMARQRSAPVQCHSSPEAASQSPGTSSKPQLPALDVKPDLDALEAAERAIAALGDSAPPDPNPDEGVMWILPEDLPEESLGRSTVERNGVRNVWIKGMKRELHAHGKVIVSIKWRPDGVAVDWKRRPPSTESEDDFEVLDEAPPSADPGSPAETEDDFEILTLDQVPQFAMPPQPVFTVSSPEPEPMPLVSSLPPEAASSVATDAPSPVAVTSQAPPPPPVAAAPNPPGSGQSVPMDQTQGLKRQRSMSPADESPHKLARLELHQHQFAPPPPTSEPSSAIRPGPAPVAAVTSVKRVYTLSSSVTPNVSSDVQPLPSPSFSPQRFHGESPTLRAKSEPHGMRSVPSGPSASPAILTGQGKLAQLHALMDKELDKLDRWTRLIELFPTREPSLKKQIERTEDTIFSLQNEMDEETHKMENAT